uniref:Aspartic proteinase n=1 Tax=Aegilops tauschii TaxID=37682 RepID=M8C6I9_AEGTA
MAIIVIGAMQLELRKLSAWNVNKWIESVVGKENVGSGVMCTTCQMVVVWIEDQLHENKTKELIKGTSFPKLLDEK